MNKKLDLLTRDTKIQVVSTHTCTYCADEYALYDLEKEVLDQQWFLYPDFCPTCRFRLLYSFLNDRHLYRRKDDETGEHMISIMSEYASWTVIEAKRHKQLMADDFGLEYGRDVTHDIFAEFFTLFADVPKPSRMIYPWLENAEYCSHSWRSTNIYLSFCIFQDCEHVYHSFRVLGKCKNIFSCVDIQNGCENLYQCRMINTSSEISFGVNIKDSSYLTFCRNMTNCTECLFCCNQTGSSYMIWNQQWSKEEYKTKKDELMQQMKKRDTFEKLVTLYDEFLQEKLVEPAVNIQNCEGVTGDNMYYGQRCVNSYMWIGNKECVNTILTGNDDKDSMVRLVNSIESGQHCENVVWCCSFGQQIYNLFFVVWCTTSSNCWYGFDLEQCEECMFCIWLQNKKYCILNKQYTKEEYMQKKQDILHILKTQWSRGSFLPRSLSKFPYNDTVAYYYFKVHTVIWSDGRSEVIDEYARGVVTVQSDDFISDATLDLWWDETIAIQRRTKDKEINVPEHIFTLSKDQLPDIDDVDEDILDKAIMCSVTGRPFRVMKQELEFLKRKWLPLPTTHNEYRVQQLIDERPTFDLHVAKSDLSWEDMLSVYEHTDKKVYSYEEYKDFMYK